MKSFLKYTCILILITLVQLYGFEMLYTQIYNKGVSRDKVSWVRSLEVKDSLDFVLLGSSRCIHHLQTTILEENSGQKGLNLGYAGSGPVEIKLMLKELLKKIKVKKVYIQIDYTFNLNDPHHLARVPWMPYLEEEDIYEEFEKYDSEYFMIRYMPFYKYQIFEPQIGFRNTFLIFMGKRGDFIIEKGFKPLNGMRSGDREFEDGELKDEENSILSEIVNICENKGIELFFYTAPYYNYTQDFDILKKHLPNYHNFSNTIIDRNLFRDGTHLNEEGSIAFTEMFYETFFENQEPLEPNAIFVKNVQN